MPKPLVHKKVFKRADDLCYNTFQRCKSEKANALRSIVLRLDVLILNETGKWMRNSHTNNKGMMELLKDYFDRREDIIFAFLFGSAARGKVRSEGDIDIAIYFRPENDVEWESFSKKYKGENRIALDLERLLKKEIDLVVLNRARSVLADEIIRKGKPIMIRDRGIFLDFLCIVSDEAEYVRDWFTVSYKEKRIASGR